MAIRTATASSADGAHDSPSAIKKLVGRLRGSSSSAASHSNNNPNKADGGSGLSSRTPSFMTLPGKSRSPDSTGSRSKGMNGDAAIALDLWNTAYDALSDDPGCTGLVVAYENIISQELPDHLKVGGLNSSFRGKTSGERQELMAAITSAGLEKRRGSKTSQADDLARKLLNSSREQIEALTNEYAAASVAWPGFCTLTPLLLDAIVQRDNFRAGLMHVVGRISWYTHLAKLLQPGSWETEQSFREQQESVREILIKLYRKVLELEMNCVCATASAWNAAAKHVVGWNSIQNVTNAIVEADGQLVEIVQQNCTNSIRDSLLGENHDFDASAMSSSDGQIDLGHPQRQQPAEAAQ